MNRGAPGVPRTSSEPLSAKGTAPEREAASKARPSTGKQWGPLSSSNFPGFPQRDFKASGLYAALLLG
jgi:hypothetical protein